MTTPHDAELQSLAAMLDDAKARVVAVAKQLEQARREDAAAALFEVERSITTAVRQVGVARRRLG